MGSSGREEGWDVDIGPLDDPRQINVPDAGLQEFLRTLICSGVDEFRLSSGSDSFLLLRVEIEPPRTPPPGSTDDETVLDEDEPNE